jgi:hypothetical protein
LPTISVDSTLYRAPPPVWAEHRAPDRIDTYLQTSCDQIGFKKFRWSQNDDSGKSTEVGRIES